MNCLQGFMQESSRDQHQVYCEDNESEQPTVQGWIVHYKYFWENFHISGILCHKFIVLLSDFTLSIWFVTSEIKE